ncbi:MAG: hypothetical protein AAGU15_01375 [Anaerolineaceae bacterium]|jgi:hypothetical protein
MTKTYFLDPNKLAKQKRSVILLYGITGVIALVVIFALQSIGGTGKPPWLAIIAIPILLVLVAVRSIRQRSDIWEHYTLTLEDGVFVQNQPNYPETRVPLGSVIATEETKEGLYLNSKQGTRIFGIPRQLKDEDYEELSKIVKDTLAARETTEPEVENSVETAAERSVEEAAESSFDTTLNESMPKDDED